MDFIELILTSLELVAEQVEDLTEPVYEHYYSESPESRGLMDHMDLLMCGRMLNEVITLLVMPDEDLQVTLKFEVKTHASNGVQLEMYGQFFNAIYVVVRDTLGQKWTPEFDTAWQQRIDFLNKEIATAVG